MNQMLKNDYMRFMNVFFSWENPSMTQDDIARSIKSSYREEHELLYKLCEELCRKFGTKINMKRQSFPNDAAGSYSCFDNVVKISNSYRGYFPWDTFAHEFGHVIEGRYRLINDHREPLLAEKFDQELIKQEIEKHFDEIQRYCFEPCITAVEQEYGAGAFDIILSHTREHAELDQEQSRKNTKEADRILTHLEECGYVDALIEYMPIVKSISLYDDRNFVLTDLYGAYFNFDYLMRESHSFSYYQSFDSRVFKELFANLTQSYFTDVCTYEETRQYLPNTVELFEKIMDLVFADLGIDKTQYRYEPAKTKRKGGFRTSFSEKYPTDLTLHGTLDDAPKVYALLQKNTYYKMLFHKNHRFPPYVAMYDFYHKRLAPLFESRALSETEFSKMVNNNFIAQFYEFYKDPSFIKGMEKEEFLCLWKQFTPKKYVKETRELFSKTKHDLVLVMFPLESTEKGQERELRLVKKGQPDAEVRIVFWNCPHLQEIMFLSKKS